MTRPLDSHSLNTTVTPRRHTSHPIRWAIGQAPHAFLADHCVYGQAILPATAFIESVLSAARAATQQESSVGSFGIADFLIQQALFLSPDTEQFVQVDLSPANEEGQPFQISSTPKASQKTARQTASEKLEPPSTLHASGKLLNPAPLATTTRELASLKASLKETAVKDFYHSCQARGIDYGPQFQVVQSLWTNPHTALGEVRLSEHLKDTLGDYTVHPALLDSCLQMLWAALPAESAGKTYLPIGIEQIRVHGAPPAAVWSHAQLRPSTNDIAANGVTSGNITSGAEPAVGFTADLQLLDEQGNVFVELIGVLVEPVTQQSLLRQPQKTLAITATFTAEPVEDTLAFWQQNSALSYQAEFAPYNQVFQTLLNPESSQNAADATVILLRLEDWDELVVPLPLQVNDSEQASLLSDRLNRQLPNQLTITHLNEYETDYLYDELFVDQVYLKHGITLKDGDCVVDVGANIGLFTLFAQQQCPNGSVYAFEPAPHAFDKLQRNAKLYCTNANLFNCGLSSSDRTETFTFYPNSSVFSSFSADANADEKAIRAVILNMLERDNSLSDAEMNALADEFLSDRLERETYEAQLRSLSSIIEEKGIERIDLLKLDAEKSELPVLQGIKDEHWPMIGQMVVEVHDQVGDVIAEVKRILTERGFEWLIDEEDMLQSSGLYNIYAIRPAVKAAADRQNLDDRPKLSRNVQDFYAALETSTGRSTAPHVVCICPPSPGAISAPNRKPAYQRIEAELAAKIKEMSGVYPLRAELLSDIYPVANYDNPRGREFGQVPYTTEFFAALGTAITRTLRAIDSPPYKVIVLDCDNTLWDGVCGEAGVNGIEISPEFSALQSFMVSQHDTGMLLCLCSKNNESDVWDVFEQRTDMVLKRSHITQSRINWQPKSENIKSLANELNLGLDSFIFVDDNPVECAEVQASCPEVLTLQLPTAHMPTYLNHVWAFDQLKTTDADKQRTVLYQQNIQREAVRQEALTFGDFLAELNLQVTIEPIGMGDLSRVSQLTHRTNQFNATTVRASESDLQQLQATGYECWKVDVCDRFGDYGTVGIVIFTTAESTLQIHSFMLSCRTLGRGVEHQMLAKLGEYAQTKGLSQVQIDYQPTHKNQPVFDFLSALHQANPQNKHQETETGSQFFFPVSFAAQLTYTPSTDTSNADTDNNNTQLNTRTTATTTDTRLLMRIANEQLSPENILEIISGKQQRARPQLDKAFVAASSSIESEIAQIWANILGLEQVGIHDNFFELGGRSLLMVQVHTQLCDHFDTQLSPVDLFKYPTVYALAQRLEQMATAQATASAENGGGSPTNNQEAVATQAINERADRKRQAREKRKQQRGSRR